MNKILKNSYIVALAALALAFNACTDEYEYDPVTSVDNSGAYILADETSILRTEFEAQTFSFTVARREADEPGSYKLYTSDEAISIPSEVSFEAGEKEKVVTVNFDVPLGTIEDSVIIGVQAEDAYTYGSQSQTFVISRCEMIANCLFYSGWLGAYWGDTDENGDGVAGVEVYEYGYTETENADGSVTTKARYLLNNPYNSNTVEQILEMAGMSQLGDNKLGHRVIFSISNSGRATLGSGEQTLFHASAEFTGGPSGDIIVSGNGRYVKEYNVIDSNTGFQAANSVMFPWTMNIGTTGYMYGTNTHAVVFPTNYNPLKQEIDDDYFPTE